MFSPACKNQEIEPPLAHFFTTNRQPTKRPGIASLCISSALNQLPETKEKWTGTWNAAALSGPERSFPRHVTRPCPPRSSGISITFPPSCLPVCCRAQGKAFHSETQLWQVRSSARRYFRTRKKNKKKRRAADLGMWGAECLASIGSLSCFSYQVRAGG